MCDTKIIVWENNFRTRNIKMVSIVRIEYYIEGNVKLMLENLAQLRDLPRDLTEPYDKAKTLLFESGLPAQDVVELSLISMSTYYRIKNGGEKELKLSNQPTVRRLAEGYDKLVTLYLDTLYGG
jgi:hypothetical protein